MGQFSVKIYGATGSVLNENQQPWVGARQMIEIVADEGIDLGEAARTETRHDRALDRVLWHFGPGRYGIAHPDIRAEVVMVPEEARS